MTTATSDILGQLFAGHQQVLRAALEQARSAVPHPTLKGDVSESDWAGMLSTHLPRRYRVCRGTVVDSRGGKSLQQDLIIHDSQYCPLFLDRGNVCFVPAESVYAVLEVKQELNSGNVADAGKKIRSVRQLYRTSAQIVDRGVARAPREPAAILGGIVATNVGWVGGLHASLLPHLSALPDEEHLDIGCALDKGAFEVLPSGGRELTVSSPDMALIAFFVRLVHRLQAVGTVPAIDWTQYLGAIDTGTAGGLDGRE